MLLCWLVRIHLDNGAWESPAGPSWSSSRVSWSFHNRREQEKCEKILTIFCRSLFRPSEFNINELFFTNLAMYLSSQYSISVNDSEEEEIGLLTSQRGSSLFSLNEVPTYGLYNRNDYMQRCYKRCRKLNDKNGQQLKRLLCFGGESSKSGDCCSTLLFTMVFILPILTVAIMVPNKVLEFNHKIIAVSCCVGMLLMLVVWHAFSIYVIVQNERKWRESWFTCEVNTAMISTKPFTPVGGTERRGNRFFDIRDHMRFYDITKDSVPNSPLLDLEQKKDILNKFTRMNIRTARLILYTKRFMKSVSYVPRNFAIILLIVTVCCFGVTVVELLAILKVF